jgi:Domain of unknown function (DUF4270)
MTKTPLKHSLTFTRSWQIDYFMKKILIDLQKVSFLLITVLFFSCENPSEIGFDFDGNANAKSVYSDTLNLDISTVLADSTVNGKSNFILTGVLNDPAFGNVTAEAYFQPSLVAFATSSGSTAIDTLSVKANPIADSLKLRIVTTGLIYGDTLSRSFFNVYRLKKPMNYSKNYNGNESIEYEGASLARFGVSSKSFKNARYDSLRAVFVDLPKNVAQEILNAAPSSGADNSKFSAAIKGFAIVPENSNKAIYSFTTGPLGGTTSTLIAKWHHDGDTTKYAYQFDLNGPRHSYLNFNRSASALAQLSKAKNELSAKLTNNLSYVQGGSGISTKIKFDKLKNLGTNIKVSKALLEFNLKAESINPLHPKIYNFVVAEVGLNNQQSRNSSNALIYLTPIGQDLSGVLHSLVDSTNTVNIDVTNYLQKITNKTVTSNGLLVMPAVVTTSGNGLLANDNLRRAVFTKPKLKIYYTKQ